MVGRDRSLLMVRVGWSTVRGQIAFYGSMPAYAPVLELYGFGDLHIRLNALSKQGRWTDMTALVPDDLRRRDPA